MLHEINEIYLRKERNCQTKSNKEHRIVTRYKQKNSQPLVS